MLKEKYVVVGQKRCRLTISKNGPVKDLANSNDNTKKERIENICFERAPRLPKLRDQGNNVTCCSRISYTVIIICNI